MQAIDLKIILEETVSNGHGDLVTRRTGQAVRGGIEQALAAARGEDVAILDFSSVRLLDLSCADEVVAKLVVGSSRIKTGGSCRTARGDSACSG